MKKISFVLSMVSFMLYALVNFAKNALEVHYHVQLLNFSGNFSSNDYAVNANICQFVLLAIAVFCLVVFIVSFFKEKKQ